MRYYWSPLQPKSTVDCWTTSAAMPLNALLFAHDLLYWGAICPLRRNVYVHPPISPSRGHSNLSKSKQQTANSRVFLLLTTARRCDWSTFLRSKKTCGCVKFSMVAIFRWATEWLRSRVLRRRNQLATCYFSIHLNQSTKIQFLINYIRLHCHLIDEKCMTKTSLLHFAHPLETGLPSIQMGENHWSYADF